MNPLKRESLIECDFPSVAFLSVATPKGDDLGRSTLLKFIENKQEIQLDSIRKSEISRPLSLDFRKPNYLKIETRKHNFSLFMFPMLHKLAKTTDAMSCPI